MSNTQNNTNNKYIRVPAVQSGPYLSSNNRINVRIPPSVYDMSKSYVEVQIRTPTVDGDPGSGEGVYQVALSYNSVETEGLFNVGLVKNCRLSSNMAGILEETQNVNRLQTNLKHFQMSYDEKASLVNSLWNQFDRHGAKTSPTRTLYRLGSTPSTNDLARIPIYLKDLFGLGEAQELDTGKLGELDIQIELDIEKITSSIFVQTTAIGMNDVTSNTNDYVITNSIQEEADIPFYVGMKVEVKHSVSTTPVVVGNGVISSIARNATTGAVTVTCGVASGGAITDVQMVGILPGPTTTKISFEGLSAVMVELPSSSQNMSGGISYMSYELEQHNGNKNTSYSDTFQLSPECVNVIGLCRSTGLYSMNNDITDYRLVLDNNNLSDRQIIFDTSLYYDSLLRTTLNQGKRLRDLNKAVNVDVNDVKNAANTSAISVKVISTPCPQTSQNKLLQVNVNGGGNGLQGFDVYKQVMKTINV